MLADGRLLAFDANTGQQLWQAPANNAVMGGPAVYNIDGQDYVTVMAGIGGGLSQEASLMSQGYRYDEGRRLLAYRLGGTAHLPASAAPLFQPAAHAVSSDPRVQRGQLLFPAYCGSCHGIGSQNASGAPDLRRSSMIDALPAVLLDGALVPAGMPSFRKYLQRTDVDALQAYLKDSAITRQ